MPETMVVGLHTLFYFNNNFVLHRETHSIRLYRYLQDSLLVIHSRLQAQGKRDILYQGILFIKRHLHVLIL